MTVPVWRIATEALAYPANDTSGAGAKLTGGRWNSPGVPMLYCSENISLAALETLSHLRPFPLPYNRFLVRVDVPDDMWSKRTQLNPLPGGWGAVPCGLTSKRAGDAWAAFGASALLVVPSVIIPDESNILINPLHADVARIVATPLKRWHYDPRFF
ncbi:MAG: RES family NAD+ phosphorylase [Pseudomonadota bacterium]